MHTALIHTMELTVRGCIFRISFKFPVFKCEFVYFGYFVCVFAIFGLCTQCRWFGIAAKPGQPSKYDTEIYIMEFHVTEYKLRLIIWLQLMHISALLLRAWMNEWIFVCLCVCVCDCGQVSLSVFVVNTRCYIGVCGYRISNFFTHLFFIHQIWLTLSGQI